LSDTTLTFMHAPLPFARHLLSCYAVGRELVGYLLGFVRAGIPS
jgi:hypothetical protein